MGKKSWIVTIAPLAIALGQTVKTFVTGDPLTAQEIELIKYLILTFVSSGAIGGSKAIVDKIKS